QESDDQRRPYGNPLRRLHRIRHRQRLGASVGSGRMATATRARVLFDEAHNEAWTIRPELASAMQPAHPADSSYALAAAALTTRDFEVVANVENPLSADAL